MFVTLETSEVDPKPWQDHLQIFYGNKITILRLDLFTNWVGTRRSTKKQSKSKLQLKGLL